MITKEQLAGMIEHTNLDVNAAPKEIERLCLEADSCGFAGVCVRPENVPQVHNLFTYNPPCWPDHDIVSVVGFPKVKCASLAEMCAELSKYTTKDKVTETRNSVMKGANHIDMVIDLSAFTERRYKDVEDDIRAVVNEAQKIPVKVILETGFLTPHQIALACKLAENAGANFAKTSTGYGIRGASVEDAQIMSMALSENMGIKVSGGISTIEFAQQLYDASQKTRKHPFRVGASKLVAAYK